VLPALQLMVQSGSSLGLEFRVFAAGEPPEGGTPNLEATGRLSFSSCIFCGMIFNGGMTIWILAVLLMAVVALAGWRQGAIRAAFFFFSLILAALLAVPLGRIFHPLLPHLGASNPVTTWALAPVFGFILGSIPLMIVAQVVHRRVEHFYKYNAGELRLALWTRLNTRLGICVGLMNGAVYFVLISFYIFNLAYWTTQMTTTATSQPLLVRLVNNLGNDLETTGFAKTASAVGTLPPTYYQLADFSGLLMQNPQLGPRLANYPGLVSLWERVDLQPLVTDPTLTNALAAGASLGEIMNAPSVQGLLANKELSKQLWGILLTNLDDLSAYLQTGKSAKYAGEKILGNWEFNAGVTVAWLRQNQPKIPASEMLAIRALWTQAYAQTTLLLTGDNQIFIKNLPKFQAQPQPNQPPFQPENWKGDWSLDGTTYTLHVTFNGEDKFMSATTDGLRLTIKDGKNLLIFDHAD
jgi:uncharacterized membrane protein required for colicin V production